MNEHWKQEPSVTASNMSEVEEGYERTHSDLRIAPAEPDESRDMSDPLNHHDLRVVEANSGQKPVG